MTTQDLHTPVLLEEVVQSLDPQKADIYLDLTAGYGGHASAVLERTQAPAVLVDRDKNAIQVLAEKFTHNDVDVRHADFLSASLGLRQEGKQFDLILADLGLSSPHLDNADRGFSLRTDGPLDMRMDQTQTLTAEIIVNSYDEAQLASILREYGEEPKARQIAKLIVDSRPLKTTHQLAQVVAKAWPGRSRVHPATRTFQALRIAVNDELTMLETALPIWIDLLKSGGRIAIISFHSLEDRIVKRAFMARAGNRYDAELKLPTTRPITAGDKELVFNPRSRSAKLRAAVKIKK